MANSVTKAWNHHSNVRRSNTPHTNIHKTKVEAWVAGGGECKTETRAAATFEDSTQNKMLLIF